MLVLSRRAGEAIVIGEDIRIRVLEVNGGLVRIGVEAPGRIPVHRDEIFQKISEENLRAAREAPEDLAILEEVMGSLSAPHEDGKPRK